MQNDVYRKNGNFVTVRTQNLKTANSNMNVDASLIVKGDVTVSKNFTVNGSLSANVISSNDSTVIIIKDSLNISGILRVDTIKPLSGTLLTIDSASFTIANNALVGATNVFLGKNTFQSLTTGVDNVGIGDQALEALTSGQRNNAVGKQALESNTTGARNIGMGYQTLQSNTTGSRNVGVGDVALTANTTGVDNVGLGESALYTNSSGNFNVAVGNQALEANIGGQYNIGIGFQALTANTASSNVGVGHRSLDSNTTGTKNTALGYQAGEAISTGSGNVFIGYDADSDSATGRNRIAIGNGAISTVDSGLFFIKGLKDLSSTAVHYNTSTGQLGPLTSSLKFKDNVVDIETDTSKVYDLQPRSYTLKSNGKREFGLIAEEVVQHFPEIVPLDNLGQPYSVDYARIVVLLISELKKLRQEVNTLKNA